MGTFGFLQEVERPHFRSASGLDQERQAHGGDRTDGLAVKKGTVELLAKFSLGKRILLGGLLRRPGSGPGLCDIGP